MPSNPLDIAVIGAGAWGSALAGIVRLNGHQVRLIGREGPAAAKGAALVLLAVPAQESRGVLAALGPRLAAGTPLVLCAKGIERESSLLMHEVAAEAAPALSPALLSGPTFAADVEAGRPTAATVAHADIATAERLCRELGRHAFRLYASDDPTGVALGGAVKNVLAIAAGAVMGAGLGANARAAMIARGLAELRRLGRALGARDETLIGLSGLGDVVLSCTDAQSRNYSFGEALGRGAEPPAVLVEGVHTLEPLIARAAGLGVELPIAEALHRVLHLGQPLAEAIRELLDRPGKRE